MSIFNSVPVTKISRSTHNLSHQVKASFDPGKLCPLMTELARPGDTWRVGMEQMVRTMPMLAPVMDMVDIKVDAFFVPIRLIWDDFEDFITMGLTGEFEATPPKLDFHSSAISNVNANKILGVGCLADYLNFPSITLGGSFDPFYIDALPFRSYQLIWNEYYMNENLDTPIEIITSSGNETVNTSNYSNYLLKHRGWRKDYFTSALPFPQKGPAVRIPTADLEIAPDGDFLMELDDDDHTWDPGLGGEPVYGGIHIAKTEDHGTIVDLNNGLDPGQEVTMKYWKGLKAVGDLPTIEELRYAEVLQEYYEANARGGTRPKEYYLNIWHTRSKDSRLDRPEYLGGYRGPLTITDIDQTSQSATTAQGTLAGKGISSGGQKLFSYHVPEWGIIMVIMSVQPKSAYYQGYRRWNLYRDAFDWPNPFFANLGEQEIWNKEIFTSGDGEDDGTFGYTPRYAECKFIPDSVHGQFRSSLDYWHLARKFASRPHLNSAFLHVQSEEMARIFPSQVMSNDKFVGTFFFHIKCKEYLPYWGVPRLLHSL